jgi:hypothetical protein
MAESVYPNIKGIKTGSLLALQAASAIKFKRESLDSHAVLHRAVPESSL